MNFFHFLCILGQHQGEKLFHGYSFGDSVSASTVTATMRIDNISIVAPLRNSGRLCYHTVWFYGCIYDNFQIASEGIVTDVSDGL